MAVLPYALDYLKSTVERLSVDKKELDDFDHRLRGL